jgi:hypothetical protein
LPAIFWLVSPKKRPLAKSVFGWEDSIKMDIREVRLEDVDWIHLAQDRDCGGIL